VLKRLGHHLRTSVLQLGRLLLGGDWYARAIGVRLGTGCRIYTSRFGTEPFLISLGDNVTVTSGVTFITHDGSLGLTRDDNGRRYTYGRIEIGSNVFIGINTIIMPAVRIGDDVVIGAGSLVNKSVPDGSVVGGVPIKTLGKFADFKKRALEEFRSAAELASCGTYRERVMKALTPHFRPPVE
jgi:acetyltransferase-like isoleucine patch superfamily enzyme